MTERQAQRTVEEAERAYGVYTEYAAPDGNIIGWLRAAQLALRAGGHGLAAARAEQVKQEVHRLSVANGLVQPSAGQVRP